MVSCQKGETCGKWRNKGAYIPNLTPPVYGGLEELKRDLSGYLFVFRGLNMRNKQIAQEQQVESFGLFMLRTINL